MLWFSTLIAHFNDANSRLAPPIGYWTWLRQGQHELGRPTGPWRKEHNLNGCNLQTNSNETSAALETTVPKTRRKMSHKTLRKMLINKWNAIPSWLAQAITNNLQVLSKGYDYLGYKYLLIYTRCEFGGNFNSLTYFDWTIIDRLAAETAFRPAQEVFLCLQQRIKAMGKIFITLGFVPTNIKIPPLCHNIILDKSTFELGKGLDEFKELLISRSRPIKQFGKVPDGRTFEETEALLTES